MGSLKLSLDPYGLHPKVSVLMVDRAGIEPATRTHFARLHTAIVLFTTAAPVAADKEPISAHGVPAIVCGPLLLRRKRSGHAFPLCPDRVLERQLPKLSYCYYITKGVFGQRPRPVTFFMGLGTGPVPRLGLVAFTVPSAFLVSG